MHKFIPMPDAMKFPDAKAAVDKEWEELEKMPARQLDKAGSTNREKESPLCYIDGHPSSQECGGGTKAPKKTKDESCSLVTL